MTEHEELIDALKFIGEMLEGINEKLGYIARPYTMRTALKLGETNDTKGTNTGSVVEDEPVLHGAGDEGFETNY